MTPDSIAATQLLEALQDALAGLNPLFGALEEAGLSPSLPQLVLSARPFHIYTSEGQRELRGLVTLSLPVERPDGQRFEIVASLGWSSEAFEVRTETTVHVEGGVHALNQTLHYEGADVQAAASALTAAVARLAQSTDS